MREFFLILGAGLISAAMGSGFGWLLASLSPEFIELLVPFQPILEPQRFGAAVGAVAGLFIGAAAMAFGLLVAAIRAWAARGPR